MRVWDGYICRLAQELFSPQPYRRGSNCWRELAHSLELHPVFSLNVAHLTVFEDHLHAVVVVDDFGSQIGHARRCAENRLHL